MPWKVFVSSEKTQYLLLKFLMFCFEFQIIVFACLLAVAFAKWGPYSYDYDMNASCSKQKCEACSYFFGKHDIAKFDCEGQCGLCALCPYNPTVPECKTYCKGHIDECVSNCNHGKQLCMACSHQCGL